MADGEEDEDLEGALLDIEGVLGELGPREIVAAAPPPGPPGGEAPPGRASLLRSASALLHSTGATIVDGISSGVAGASGAADWSRGGKVVGAAIGGGVVGGVVAGPVGLVLGARSAATAVLAGGAAAAYVAKQRADSLEAGPPAEGVEMGGDRTAAGGCR